MLFEDISDLPLVSERAIIINHNTKLVTTLALLSTLRYASMPVLLVECESSDGSLEHFQSMMGHNKFDIVKAPLRTHGQTLDWIFEHVLSDKILLVDSDLEINNSCILDFFKEYIDEPSVFACGFLNGPGWLNNPAFGDLDGALYHERPWMPLVLFKVDPVRQAINNGRSFNAFRWDNEYSLFPLLSFIRAKSRVMRVLLRKGPQSLRRTFYGAKPSLVYFDTGAHIYDYLRYIRKSYFVGLPEPIHPKYVTHFFGVTRHVLNPHDTTGGGGLEKIEKTVKQRLLEVYEINAF